LRNELSIVTHRALRLFGAATTAALVTSACASSHSNADALPEQRRQPAERELSATDFRFLASTCSDDEVQHVARDMPGVLTWNGRSILAADLITDAVGTIQELGEDIPPEVKLGWNDAFEGGRYVRIDLEGKTQTLILRGVRSKLPFSVGDEVRYSHEPKSSGGFGGAAFALTLRARSGELLLQYAYLGDVESLELPPGLEVDMSEELCVQTDPCGGSVRAPAFQDARGNSTRIEPGEARAFAGFDIYVYGLALLPDDLSRRGLDCRPNTIDLLLLRAGR
jgi:hypothetical protein